jgi:hypothetical protein
MPHFDADQWSVLPITVIFGAARLIVAAFAVRPPMSQLGHSRRSDRRPSGLISGRRQFAGRIVIRRYESEGWRVTPSAAGNSRTRHASIARRANLPHAAALAASGKSERYSRASRLDEEGRTRGRHDT